VKNNLVAWVTLERIGEHIKTFGRTICETHGLSNAQQGCYSNPTLLFYRVEGARPMGLAAWPPNRAEKRRGMFSKEVLPKPYSSTWQHPAGTKSFMADIRENFRESILASAFPVLYGTKPLRAGSFAMKLATF
jgi:hypothetical protein